MRDKQNRHHHQRELVHGDHGGHDSSSEHRSDIAQRDPKAGQHYPEDARIQAEVDSARRGAFPVRGVAWQSRRSYDPFRPEQPPIEPMVINAVQELLRGGAPDDVANSALEARNADPDYALTSDEEARLRRLVTQCGAASDELIALLDATVAATPWVGKFGASASFGVGDAADPYVRACRAECMLALLILHVDGGDVAFIDEERLEVLRDAPPGEALDAVRQAAASAAA